MPTTLTLVARAMTPSESREAALHGYVPLPFPHRPAVNSKSTLLTPAPHPWLLSRSKRALTPILSGAISGGIVGVAWIVGIVYWLYKRHRRARRAKAAGLASYREFLEPPRTKEPFILPPDPAVVKGQVLPGQKIVLEKRHKHKRKHKHGDGDGDGDGDRDGNEGAEEREKEKGPAEAEAELAHAKTVPMTHAEERKLAGVLQEVAEEQADGAGAYGSTVNLRGDGPLEDSESAQPGVVHSATAPARVPSKRSLKSTRSSKSSKKRDSYPPRTSIDSQKPSPKEKAPEDYWYQKRSST
ncbi:hypothetical protein GSI_08157 [Ganoderma sinense ZZ0214-1]|uniref:Uncharacterized protein n=1 Tax=Ganoderma sinense ZZ0214-1 TaxID=1077348 RepID=A0A2G8S7G7_9APHY|nr:hypothetical protein GSI_08157 [Ganoderma sinense ZZ0214-1]